MNCTDGVHLGNLLGDRLLSGCLIPPDDHKERHKIVQGMSHHWREQASLQQENCAEIESHESRNHRISRGGEMRETEECTGAEECGGGRHQLREPGLEQAAKQQLFPDAGESSQQGQLSDGSPGQEGTQLADHEVDQPEERTALPAQDPHEREQERPSGDKPPEQRPPAWLQCGQG
jgi:hypothetical protein